MEPGNQVAPEKTPDKSAPTAPVVPETKPVDPANMEVTISEGGQKMKVAELTKSYSEIRAAVTRTTQENAELKRQLAEAKAKNAPSDVVEQLVARLQAVKPTAPADPLADPTTRKAYLKELAEKMPIEDALDLLVTQSLSAASTTKAEATKLVEGIRTELTAFKEEQKKRDDTVAALQKAKEIHEAVPEYTVTQTGTGFKMSPFARTVNALLMEDEPADWLGGKKPSETDATEVARAYKAHLAEIGRAAAKKEAEDAEKRRLGTPIESGAPAAGDWEVPDDIKNKANPNEKLEAIRQVLHDMNPQAYQGGVSR